MSRWETNFNNQQALQKVQGIQRIVESTKTDDLPPAALEEMSRLIKVLKIIEAKLSSVDPELFRHNSWGSFSNWLNTAQSNIEQYNQNRNVGHLQNANNLLDEILTIIRPAGSEYTSEDIKALAEANSQFTQTIVQELETVRKRSQEVKAQLDSLSAAVADAKARLADQDKVIQEQKARLDQSIAGFQKQFSDAQEKRTTDYAAELKKNSGEFSAQVKEFAMKFNEETTRRKQEYETFFETARKHNDSQLEFLRKREDEVNKIFGAIGSTSFAGNFKTTADNEANAANLWRWIALGLMAAMIVVGGWGR